MQHYCTTTLLMPLLLLLQANLDVLSWTLDADDMRTLDTLPHRVRCGVQHWCAALVCSHMQLHFKCLSLTPPWRMLQQRMVTGVMWLHPRGPYRTLAELWDNEEEVEHSGN